MERHLLERDLADRVTALKERHDRTLAAVGAGELTHALTTLGPEAPVAGVFLVPSIVPSMG